MNEQLAREILGVITGAECIRADGSLHGVIEDIQDYEVLSWVPNDISATLDGTFSADELEAIAWWMRNSPLNQGDDQGKQG